jgi:hypothetical protein
MGKLGDGRSKKRGKNHVKYVELKRPEGDKVITPTGFHIHDCDECKTGWPATFYQFAGQWLCEECVKPKVLAFIATLCGVLTGVVLLLF